MNVSQVDLQSSLEICKETTAYEGYKKWETRGDLIDAFAKIIGKHVDHNHMSAQQMAKGLHRNI